MAHKISRSISTILLFVTLSAASYADNHQIQLFFGLSIPSGGQVSNKQWLKFEQEEIASTFTGFNVTNSIGYYQGKAETSKIITLIVNENQLAQATKKAQSLAKQYTRLFLQDSVLLTTIPVSKFELINSK